jgi:hypothetical protein
MARGIRKQSVIVTPRSVQTDPEAARETQKQADMAEINRHNESIKDDLGSAVGSDVFITDKTWPYLTGKTGQRYSVSRWYFKINTAVDIFVSMAGNEEEVKFKREAFKKADIKYGALDYSMKPSDLIPQIGFPVPV